MPLVNGITAHVPKTMVVFKTRQRAVLMDENFSIPLPQIYSDIPPVPVPVGREPQVFPVARLITNRFRDSTQGDRVGNFVTIPTTTNLASNLAQRKVCIVDTAMDRMSRFPAVLTRHKWMDFWEVMKCSYLVGVFRGKVSNNVRSFIGASIKDNNYLVKERNDGPEGERRKFLLIPETHYRAQSRTLVFGVKIFW
jgi:hypothetical protein